MSTGGKVFVAIVLLGLLVIGVGALADAQAHGETLLFPLALLAAPLLGLGWLLVRIGTYFITGWRYGGDGQKLIVGCLAAVIAGAGLIVHIQATVPNQRPAADVVAALAPACQGMPVAGAGSAHVTGSVARHMVVLDESGRPHGWTGHPPLSWRPASVADAELVACISAEDTQSKIQVCNYVNGPPITRYAASRDVRIVETATGHEVAHYVLRDEARACGQTEQKDVTELRGEVTWSMVEDRCCQLVDPAGASGSPQPTDSPPGQPTESPDRPTAQPTETPDRPTAQPTTPSPTELPVGRVELTDAIDQGLVEAKVVGDGLQSVDLELRSLVDEDLEVLVELGTMFEPRRSGTQSMVSVGGLSIDLAAGEDGVWQVPVACARMRRDQPTGDDRFTITAPARGDLARLLRAPSFDDQTFRVQQFAVWTITNNPARGGYVALGTALTIFGTGPSKAEFASIRDLLDEAGIDPSDYRAFH